jgi:hypothetical protein
MPSLAAVNLNPSNTQWLLKSVVGNSEAKKTPIPASDDALDSPCLGVVVEAAPEIEVAYVTSVAGFIASALIGRPRPMSPSKRAPL